MSKEKIYIFDTTLRDGAQTQGVNFSMNEKNRIANALSKLGVDYIEAGWPGANPLDTNFFNKPPKLSNSTLVAFGMTKKPVGALKMILVYLLLLIQILSPFVSLEKHGIFTLM